MTLLWLGLGGVLSVLIGRRLAEPGWMLLRPVLALLGVPWPCVAALGFRSRSRAGWLALGLLCWSGGPWSRLLYLLVELQGLRRWRRRQRTWITIGTSPKRRCC